MCQWQSRYLQGSFPYRKETQCDVVAGTPRAVSMAPLAQPTTFIHSS